MSLLLEVKYSGYSNETLESEKIYKKDYPGTELKEFSFIPKQSCLVGRNHFNCSIKDYSMVS